VRPDLQQQAKQTGSSRSNAASKESPRICLESTSQAEYRRNRLVPQAVWR
jgi:hypothetical protein